jgi:sigma-B regulation protein RsbU (phosphoserine phosphatase)
MKVHALRQAKILIVDDEPLNIDYLEQELEDLGYETLVAANGQEALELVKAEVPDMILLDIMMPVMNGFEVLARLKAEKSWRDIPVVMISALSDIDSIVKGIEMGAEDFLPKPFDPIILQARLNAGLEKKRLRDLEHLYMRSLERELEIGREIQSGFLPDEIPQPSGWEIVTYFRAAREVAGDYYDVFQISKKMYGLMLGDVCNKGVGSALYMALYRSLLRATLNLTGITDSPHFNGSPDDFALALVRAVRFTNSYILNVHQTPLFTTLFYGILDVSTGILVYINAGQDPPLVLRRGEIVSRLMPTGAAVGLFLDKDFSCGEITLLPDDLLLVYTDGIRDVQNAQGDFFGKERFYSLLSNPEAEASSLTGYIMSSVDAFLGDAAQYDDIAMVVVQRKN